MYVQGEPVCKYVQEERVPAAEAGAGGAAQGQAAGLAGSQVDPPQVSGRCDRVALRTQLLGTLRGQGRL